MADKRRDGGRIKADIWKITRFSIKVFTFNMTDHMAEFEPGGWFGRGGLYNALSDLADFITNSANTAWIDENFDLTDPIWYLSSHFRMCPIGPDNPLWRHLDPESQRTNRNWLIFKFHPLNSQEIIVTHFGPFGKENNKNYGENWSVGVKAFMNDVQIARFRNAVKGSETEEQKEEAKKNLKAYINGHYIKVRDEYQSQVDTFKVELRNIAAFAYGEKKADEIMATLASGLAHTLLMTLLMGIVTSLAMHMAEESAKEAAKRGASVAVGQVPLVGLGLGVAYALNRARKGNFGRAALELAAGAASTIPLLGTAVSAPIGMSLAAMDVTEAGINLVRQQSKLEQVSKQLEALYARLEKLEQIHVAIMNVFFREFDYAATGEQFVDAFSKLMAFFSNSHGIN